MIYNRKTKEYFEEEESQQNILKFLYTTYIGRFLLNRIAIKPNFNKWWGLQYKSLKSNKKIEPFIKKYNIELGDYKIADFNSFNDFFIRKKDINVDRIKNHLIAGSSGKLSVYKIDDTLKLQIKNSVYNINDIVENNIDMKEYKKGYCLVFRLSLTDYHRYIFIDDGYLKKYFEIDGVLHTVRSISNKYKVFIRNKRSISLLNYKKLGEVIQIEVGALTIGVIKNMKKSIFCRGEEKGYFEYGGSTIVMFFKEGSIEIDEDILKQSEKDIETQVEIGEKIGVMLKGSENYIC